MHRYLLPLPLTALSAACIALQEPAELGSPARPVRCDGKRGELAYLGRLRCPSGAPPNAHFQRRGPRAPDGHETDEFALRCVTDNRSERIFLDRHHAGLEETRAVRGFELAAIAATPESGGGAR